MIERLQTHTGAITPRINSSDSAGVGSMVMGRFLTSTHFARIAIIKFSSMSQVRSGESPKLVFTATVVVGILENLMNRI